LYENHMKTKPFKDKVVVVTGAASGIGAAISRKFAREGATLGLLDADEPGVDALREQLARQGVQAFGVGCDVSRQEDCDAAIEKIIDRFGGIDILVNNAGITQRSAFVHTRPQVYRKVMDVNFFGSLYCTQAAIAGLIQRKGMVIVIESLAGVTPLLGRTAYSASKHALHGLFTTLRAEMRREGVHVMIVCPGFVKTNLQTRALGGDGHVTTHPQSRMGKQSSPEKTADIICAAALKRKPLVVITPLGKIGYWLSRVAPVFYERIMERQFRSELER